MTDAYVFLDPNDTELRERSIDSMVKQLRGIAAQAKGDSVHQRLTGILSELMPVFLRALDRERATFLREVKDKDAAAVDRYMTVMMMPIVNMVGASITALVPCQHPDEPCDDCVDMRMALLRNSLENLFEQVMSYVTCPVTGAGHGRLQA